MGVPLVGPLPVFTIRECVAATINERQKCSALGAIIDSIKTTVVAYVRMSRKKVWNSIMRRKKKNHLDINSKDENSPSGNVCKFVRKYLVSLERNLLQALARITQAYGKYGNRA